MSELLASVPDHASLTFWIVMTAIDVVAAVVFGALAFRTRRTADSTDRLARYAKAAWGFTAFASLCLARAALLMH